MPIFALLLFWTVADAQTFTGTMTVGDYTRENTKVRLQQKTDGTITLTMYHVKFARMMPVTLDISLSPLVPADGLLKGNDIVPISGGKPYEKYTVRDFTGKTSGGKFSFSCMMGGRKLVFNGSSATKSSAKAAKSATSVSSAM